jgi:hypothetical protein
MAFVVEDGTGLSTATSYVSVAFADTFADSFYSESDYLTWSALADSAKERYLNRSAAYLDRTYIFTGQLYSSSQALKFPREEVYNELEEEVSGVPDDIKKAVCLVAKRLMNGTELDPDLERGGAVKREKIDTIDITYSDSASSATKFYEIENLLKSGGLILSNRNSRVNVRLSL